MRKKTIILSRLRRRRGREKMRRRRRGRVEMRRRTRRKRK